MPLPSGCLYADSSGCGRGGRLRRDAGSIAGVGGRLLTRRTLGWIPLVLGVASALAFAGETAVGRDLGDAGPRSFVLTQLPVGTPWEKQPSASGGMLRAGYGEGARVVEVLPDRSVRLLTQGFHSACDPDVSFDGKRVLFAGKRTAGAPWDVFEITLASGEVRQVTRNMGDCRSPGYQSSMYYYHPTDSQTYYHVTLVSNAAGTLNEDGATPAWHLYGCRLDGTDFQRLTFNLSSDVDPYLMWDGRLAYASWQRRSLVSHGMDGRVALLGVNLDGGDCAPYVAGGKRVQQMPCATTGGLLVFVESDRLPWDGAGTLACATIRRPLHSYRPLTAEPDGLFHSPSPLPDGRILVSRRPADGTGTHGVYCLDPATKRLEPVYDDPRFHDIQAKAVYARPEPDGRSSPVSPNDPNGKLYCLNVYTTEFKDRTWMAPGSAKTLRVLEGVPRKAGAPHAVKLAARRVLGEVPLAPDGSFNVEVPANTAIELQLLDEQGIAMRSCGWVWTRNHFNQGCVGCHEDPELTPENTFVAALAKPSVVVAPPPDKRESVDFHRDLMPIVAKKCLSCHGKDGSPPNLVGTNASGPADAGEAIARRVYETLVALDPTSGAREARGKYVDPGRARTSPLIWHVLGRNTSRPWDGPTQSRPAKPIPPGKSEPLSEAESRVLIRWIDLGAPWDAGPAQAGVPSSRGDDPRREP